MRSIHVPETPAWLLKTFGCSPNNEALLGDLAEHVCCGKTAAWYWRQAVTGVFGSLFSQVHPQPLTVLRAVTAGWLIYWPLGYVIFHFGFYQVALDSLDLDSPDLLIGSWTPPIWYHTAAFGRIYTYAADAIATTVMIGIGVFTGWIVASLFRPNSRPALLVFSGTVLVSWICYSATLGDSDIGARLPWSAYFWMNCFLQTCGILVGGLTRSASPVGRSLNARSASLVGRSLNEKVKRSLSTVS